MKIEMKRNYKFQRVWCPMDFEYFNTGVIVFEVVQGPLKGQFINPDFALKLEFTMSKDLLKEVTDFMDEQINEAIKSRQKKSDISTIYISA